MPNLDVSHDNNDVLKLNDEIGEKENKLSKSDNINKERKFSELHISFLVAFVECNFEKVNSILSKDPSLVDMKNPFDGNTALHLASKFGEHVLIKSLIGNYNADVNIINHSGKTPLHYAVEFSQVEIVNLLIAKYNAKKDIRDYNGKLAVDWAKSDVVEAIQKILGTPSYVLRLKEDKAPMQRISMKLKNFGSMIVHEGSPKNLFSSLIKGTESFSLGHRTLPNSVSSETLNSKHYLTVSNSDNDKLHVKKGLMPKADKSFYKAAPGIRGSFSGKIN